MINEDKLLKKEIYSNEIKIKAKELLSLSTHLIFNKNNIKKNEFIIKTTKSYYILDIVKVAKLLCLAEKIIFLMAKKNKKILFVSSNINTSNFLVDEIENLLSKNCFYIINKWVGGFITNWKNFKSKINYLKELEKNTDKLSKKDSINSTKEIKKLNKNFQGIKNMSSLPDIIIFISLPNEILAAQECKKYGITTIGINNLTLSSGLLDINIPINNESFNSVKYILNLFFNAIAKAYNN